jgi:hypothetical protein
MLEVLGLTSANLTFQQQATPSNNHFIIDLIILYDYHDSLRSCLWTMNLGFVLTSILWRVWGTMCLSDAITASTSLLETHLTLLVSSLNGSFIGLRFDAAHRKLS